VYGLRKRTVAARSKAVVEAAARSEAGFKAVACSEAAVCSGLGIEDGRRRWHDSV
jgi:2-methylisocitrate lyase-like PEP mutase family enzyme